MSENVSDPFSVPLSQSDRQGFLDFTSEAVITGRKTCIDTMADVFNIQLFQGFPEKSAVGLSSCSIILTQQQPKIKGSDTFFSIVCVSVVYRVFLVQA